MATYHGSSTAKNTPGVEGDNATGTGVLGTAGAGTGVIGTSDTGVGVWGHSKSLTGTGGVSETGIGVQGVSPVGPGVRGDSDNGVGVFGSSKASTAVGGMSDAGMGVQGISKTASGVSGVSTSGRGVDGSSTSADAVFGASDSGRGVVGTSNSATAVEGNSRDGAGLWGTSEKAEAVHGETNSLTFAAITGVQLNPAGTGAGVYAETRGPGVAGAFVSAGGDAVWGSSQGGEAVHGQTNSAGAAAIAGFQRNAAGTGAGVYGETHGPGAAGAFFSRGQGSAGYFEGDVRVTGALRVAVDIILDGADCAEDFEVAEGVTVEPGSVVVVGADGAILPSSQPYDSRVAGIVSGAGGYRPGLVLDRAQPSSQRKPVAMFGKVYCKVDADYAPVSAGDLLTTSATCGHAMKAADRAQALGAIVGKALRPLARGCGLIPVLVVHL